MPKRITTSLAFLLLLLCSCAVSPGSSAIAARPTSAVIPMSAPTPAVSPTAPFSQSTANTPTSFSVTGVEMSVTPATLSTWACGSFIQVVYTTTFHVVSGPSGGVIDFAYTLNNGRSQIPEKLTIIAGQHLSSYVWTWQGALPADHTSPGSGGVMVSSPNQVVSHMVTPQGACR